jgi:hypothetical protein
MTDDEIIQPLLNERPLTVTIIDGEIVLAGSASPTPCLTADRLTKQGIA